MNVNDRIKIIELKQLLARADELIRNARPGVREGMAGEKQTELWFMYADEFADDYTKMMEKK